MTAEIRVIGLDGIPEAKAGDDLVAFISDSIDQHGPALEDGDIIVITHKFVSKAEGRVISFDDIEPSDFARRYAERTGKDPRHVEVVLQEANRIVRMNRGILIAETRHGFICANAGVDASNVSGKAGVSLLPIDPDATAEMIRAALAERYGVRLAVIITDTFGRPWRRGQTNVAIGVAGMSPLLDYRGQQDAHGYELAVTVIAVADEIAGAAELVMGKLDQRPVAVVRGYRWEKGEGEEMGAVGLVMSADRDLFR